MSSLRAEHGGAIDILLTIYVLQIYLGNTINPAQHHITIWIDNAEVLNRGKIAQCDSNIKAHMVLDYDMWQVMNTLQQKINFQLIWEKVDSHIDTKVYKEGTKPKGDTLPIRLNKQVRESISKQDLTKYLMGKHPH